MPDQNVIGGCWNAPWYSDHTKKWYCEAHKPKGARRLTLEELHEITKVHEHGPCARCTANLLRLRNQHRDTTCCGSRHNYYNFPKEKSPNGDVAMAEDYGCWHLGAIKQGVCPCHS